MQLEPAATIFQLNSPPRLAIAPIMLLHALVKGQVQGVGFRYFVLKTAEQLHLTGWVRNLPNGNVEVEAEGDDDALYEFEQALWKGPHFSNVQDVTCTRSDHDPGYSSFEVKR